MEGLLSGSFIGVLLFYSALLASVQSQSQRTIRLPLTRVTTKKVGINGQPVTNYYAPINIGTPAKMFNIQFDTALGSSFVPQFEKFPTNMNMHHAKGYNCRNSTTSIDSNFACVFTHQQCRLMGWQYEDVMSFGNARGSNGSLLNGSVSVNHTFVAAVDASEANFKYLPIDGLFALGPETRPSVANFLYSLLDHIDNYQFSMWFSRGMKDTPPEGELIFGGDEQGARIDGQAITWHSVSGENRQVYSLKLRHVSLGGDVVSCAGKQCLAILSSGSDALLGPQADVERIYQLLNTTRRDNLEYVDCGRVDELPALAFAIGADQYSLQPDGYVRKVDASGESCYVTIQSLKDAKPHWILGTNFLESYYTIFDVVNDRIGFGAFKWPL